MTAHSCPVRRRSVERRLKRAAAATSSLTQFLARSRSSGRRLTQRESSTCWRWYWRSSRLLARCRMRFRSALLLASLPLTGCGSTKPTPDPRIEVLEQRLAEQVRRIDALEAARKRALLDATNTAASSGVQLTSYLLIGGGTLAEDGKRYATQAECDAAKKQVLDNAPELESQARERGAAFVPPAAMSCLPALSEATGEP